MKYKLLNIVIIGALSTILIISMVAYIKDDNVHLSESIIIGKCRIKEMTGYDCPSCGLTRSFVSISNGRILKSFSYNPVGLAIYLLVISQIINSSIYILKTKYNTYISRFNFIFSLLICVSLIVNWII
ncbi:MAG: DUF2752 domain-containing protein [Vallitalea sp.]|jgi:hypothetical protein|nr:DUF2752 domain-containing protein [Vallitalea sp.]